MGTTYLILISHEFQAAGQISLLQITETTVSFLIQSCPTKKAGCFHVSNTPVNPLSPTQSSTGHLDEPIIYNIYKNHFGLLSGYVLMEHTCM